MLVLARKLADHTAQPLEQKEEELEQEGEKLQTVRSEFAANVSHELKTPLTSIKGFTDMMSSGMVKDPEDQKRFITMIGVEVDRLIELINDVLKISELESVVMPQSDDRQTCSRWRRSAALRWDRWPRRQRSVSTSPATMPKWRWHPAACVNCLPT